MISIIVPIYNIEKYLAHCIDSVLNSTLTDFELILVDDGSTDSSGSICDDYSTRDERITVIHQENGGISVARNHAEEGVLHYCMFWVFGAVHSGIFTLRFLQRALLYRH